MLFKSLSRFVHLVSGLGAWLLLFAAAALYSSAFNVQDWSTQLIAGLAFGVSVLVVTGLVAPSD